MYRTFASLRYVNVTNRPSLTTRATGYSGELFWYDHRFVFQITLAVGDFQEKKKKIRLQKNTSKAKLHTYTHIHLNTALYK